MRIIFCEIMQVRIYVSDEILLSVLSPIAHLQTACMAMSKWREDSDLHNMAITDSGVVSSSVIMLILRGHDECSLCLP